MSFDVAMSFDQEALSRQATQASPEPDASRMGGRQGSKLGVTSPERDACRDLPDLRDRIDAMGLSQEYSDFCDRYMGWRTGAAMSARGEVSAANIVSLKSGFGYWYPSKDVWTFQRTLSYWISVLFFEGSIFFVISSFLLLYPESLGIYSFAVTTGGYMCGKISFLICTYLMCLEVVNLSSDRDHGSSNGWSGSSSEPHEPAEPPTFNYSPFRHRKALSNLKKMGLGPWPYYASLVYFVGVNIFIVGLAAEFLPIPDVVAQWVGVIAFVIGSSAFVAEGWQNVLKTRFLLH